MHPKNRSTGLDLSSALLSPRQAPRAARQPTETATPTDLVTIVGGARLHEDLGESQVRAWCNRGLLKFYANPDPRAGRRPGRGRPVTRWISVRELADFVTSRKVKSEVAP